MCVFVCVYVFARESVCVSYGYVGGKGDEEGGEGGLLGV